MSILSNGTWWAVNNQDDHDWSSSGEPECPCVLFLVIDLQGGNNGHSNVERLWAYSDLAVDAVMHTTPCVDLSINPGRDKIEVRPHDDQP